MTIVAVGAAFASEERPGWLGMGLTWHESSEGPFLRVEEVLLESPAEKAGVRELDLILGLNGTGIPFVREIDLLEFLRTLRPGDSLTLNIMRNGESLDVKVEVEPRPDDYAAKMEESREYARKKASQRKDKD